MYTVHRNVDNFRENTVEPGLRILPVPTHRSGSSDLEPRTADRLLLRGGNATVACRHCRHSARAPAQVMIHSREHPQWRGRRSARIVASALAAVLSSPSSTNAKRTGPHPPLDGADGRRLSECASSCYEETCQQWDDWYGTDPTQCDWFGQWYVSLDGRSS